LKLNYYMLINVNVNYSIKIKTFGTLKASKFPTNKIKGNMKEKRKKKTKSFMCTTYYIALKLKYIFRSLQFFPCFLYLVKNLREIRSEGIIKFVIIKSFWFFCWLDFVVFCVFCFRFIQHHRSGQPVHRLQVVVCN